MSAYVDTSVLGAYYCPEALSSAVAETRKILNLFASHVSVGFYRRMSLTGEHYLRARRLIDVVQIPLHTLDALHLAAALAESLPLLTADKGLAAAAKRHKCKLIFVH